MRKRGKDFTGKRPASADQGGHAGARALPAHPGLGKKPVSQEEAQMKAQIAIEAEQMRNLGFGIGVAREATKWLCWAVAALGFALFLALWVWAHGKGGTGAFGAGLFTAALNGWLHGKHSFKEETIARLQDRAKKTTAVFFLGLAFGLGYALWLAKFS